MIGPREPCTQRSQAERLTKPTAKTRGQRPTRQARAGAGPHELDGEHHGGEEARLPTGQHRDRGQRREQPGPRSRGEPHGQEGERDRERHRRRVDHRPVPEEHRRRQGDRAADRRRVGREAQPHEQQPQERDRGQRREEAREAHPDLAPPEHGHRGGRDEPGDRRVVGVDGAVGVARAELRPDEPVRLDAVAGESPHRGVATVVAGPERRVEVGDGEHEQPGGDRQKHHGDRSHPFRSVRDADR